MESNVRQIATRQNCECFRGVRGVELEKPLFPAERSKTARMRGVSLVFVGLHALARQVKSVLAQPAALRRSQRGAIGSPLLAGPSVRAKPDMPSVFLSAAHEPRAPFAELPSGRSLRGAPVSGPRKGKDHA